MNEHEECDHEHEEIDLDSLLRAMRNPEFGVGHLESWAEMLQILKDISQGNL